MVMDEESGGYFIAIEPNIFRLTDYICKPWSLRNVLNPRYHHITSTHLYYTTDETVCCAHIFFIPAVITAPLSHGYARVWSARTHQQTRLHHHQVG
jgi:hypothetical protein